MNCDRPLHVDVTEAKKTIGCLLGEGLWPMKSRKGIIDLGCGNR